MNQSYTAVVKQDGQWWIGWIEEVPGANVQEKSKNELIISLKEAAKDILELHRQAAIKEAEKDFEEIPLVL